MNLLYFSLTYFIIIYSVVGYGLLFLNSTKKIYFFNNFGYAGLTGILLSIVYSYFSHFFFPHNIYHNFIYVLAGLIFFVFYYYRNIEIFKKEFKLLNIIFIVLFISIVIFKTHDDFPYYHFPYSYYLTQNSALIGIGQYNHGFRTPSSILYLNSLFYLPIIKLKIIHISSVLFMGFANIVFIKKIIEQINIRKINYILIFSLLSFIFINIFFYRIAEHGTDRSAQILILILILNMIILFNIDTNFKNQLVKIYLLIALIISLKAFYILYLIFLIPVIYFLYKKLKIFDLTKLLFLNSFFLLLFLTFIFVLAINFINTGCLIYPLNTSCFYNLSWSIDKNSVEVMSNWYELWSKAGANPNERVLNQIEYIQYLNWLPNWIDDYFFNKVSDFLFGLLVLSLIVYLTFYSKKKLKKKYITKTNFTYLILLGLLFEWFYNHPALRYGGYSLIASIVFLYVSIKIEKNNLKVSEVKNKITVLIIITIIIFSGRNINRIYKEVKQYNYNPLININYRFDKNHFRIQESFDKRINNYEDCVLDKKSCNQELKDKTIKFFNTYIFKLK